MLVGERDAHDERDSSERRGEEEEDRQARVPENAEGRGHLHQQRGPHDQGREDQPEGDPVGDLVQTVDQHPLVHGVHVQAELVVGEDVEHLVHAAGQLLDEALGLEQARVEIGGRCALGHPALHQLRRVLPHRSVRVERRIERPPDLV